MKLGIIGAGPAGMMAAITAASSGVEVTLLEHTSRAGKKILSTGNGKCNFTNQNLSKDDYYTDHPSFVAKALAKFGNEELISFFDKLGMHSTSKRDGYYYPATEAATTVLHTLLLQLSQSNISLLTDCKVNSIKAGKDCFTVQTSLGEFVFDKLILACGGKAASFTGSDGSGYKLAKALGHNIKKPMPALMPLYSTDAILKDLAGVRIMGSVSVRADGTEIASESGQLQLNKDSISGIPVFQLSHPVALAIDQGQKVVAYLDFKQEVSLDNYIEELQVLRSRYPKCQISEVLSLSLHPKICKAVLQRAKLEEKKNLELVTDKQLEKLATAVKGFSLILTGYADFQSAQVTQGGVLLSEISEEMESNLVKNLYIVGELLDVDGRCGGYNLQWAFTTGYIAGLSATKK